MLEERRQRLEEDKKEKEAKTKAERKAVADARRNASNAQPDPAKAKQASYAQQQRKRQQDAKLERQRILRIIESDKAARREREELRKALAKAEAEEADAAHGLANEQLARETEQAKSQRIKDCALQIRLFDGSTIRQKFPADQTLRSHVRPWIEQKRSDGDAPYTFKQILTPSPNRTLSILDEEESLHSLGLTPGSTLVMVPVQEFTAAYVPEADLISRGVSAGYNLVASGAGIMAGALGTLLGIGQASPSAQQTPRTATDTSRAQLRSTGSEINVRTFRDQRQGTDNHQLYNGNQVS